MRRVLIDSHIVSIAKDFVLRVKNIDATKAVSPRIGLKKLENKLKRSNIKHKDAFMKYLSRVSDKDNYYSILNASPDEMIKLIAEFDNILPYKVVSKTRFGGKGRKFFHDALVGALRYDLVQSQIYPALMPKLGIKSCVYCNASLAIEYERISNSKKPKISSIVCRYELDHFYPKSQYPFLATSFYNLQPVCGTCNRNKSNRKSLFNLYTTQKSEVDVFKFELAEGSLAKFTISFDEQYIDVKFKPEDSDLTKNHQELFGIDGLYKTQKDIVAEIIVRALAYPSSYKNSLIRQFEMLKLDKNFVDRVVAGNYLDPKDTHRRPLAKLYSDIWSEVYGSREI
jgi:hypothetical protein